MSASVISMESFRKSAEELAETESKQEPRRRVPVSVLVHWSESGDFGEEELIAFDEFEQRAFSVAVGNAGRGYLKTKITVNFDDGEQYGCRLDLAAHDDLNFAHHCRAMIEHANTQEGIKYYAEHLEAAPLILFLMGCAFDFNDQKYAAQAEQAQAAEETAKYEAVEQQKKEKEAAAAAFAAEVERIKTAPEYAHLAQFGAYAKDTDIAKNIRADLKKHFPGVKFSVRKEHYNCISVAWDNGPTDKQVEEITGKYKCGTFDGMTDCSGWDNTPFDQVFGAVRYLHTHREVGEEIRAAAVKIVEKNEGEPVTGDNNQRFGGEWAADLVWRETNRISQNADGLTYTTHGGQQIAVSDLLKSEETAEQTEQDEPAEDEAPEQPAAAIVDDKAEKPRFKATSTAAGWSVTINFGSVSAEYGPLSADSYAAAIAAAWALHTAPTDPDDDPSGGGKITRAETLGDYAARIDARRERAHIRAVKAAAESDRRYQIANKIGERFWGGQPILVGHHSESRARRDHARIDQNMRACIDASKKAAHYEQKASTTGAAGIASDNPQAVELLKKKLKRLENASEIMKKANAAIRRGATDSDLVSIGLSESSAAEALKPDYAGRRGFAAWAFSNNSAERRRIKYRIAELEALHTSAPIDKSGEGWAMYEDDGRICIKFDSIPAEELRAKIKRHGFKWSRSRSVWVRKITANAVSSAETLSKQIDY